MVPYKEELVPIDDDEVVQSISIILAAHSEKFPQLRGSGVKPNEKDDKRRRFANELVSQLRMSRVAFFRRMDDSLIHNSKWFSEGKR